MKFEAERGERGGWGGRWGRVIGGQENIHDLLVQASHFMTTGDMRQTWTMTCLRSHSKSVADGARAAAPESCYPDGQGRPRGRGVAAVRSLQEPPAWCPGFCPSPPASPLAVVCSQCTSQRDPTEQELEVGCSSAQSPSIVPISLGVRRALKAHFTSLVKLMGRHFIFIYFYNCIPFTSLNLPRTTLPFLKKYIFY